MSDDPHYAALAARWLGGAVANGIHLFDSFSTEALGSTLPDAVIQSPTVTAALAPLRAAADDAGTAAAKFETQPVTLTTFLELGSALVAFYKALDALDTAIKESIDATSIPDPPTLADARAFADEFAKRMSDFVLAAVLAEELPRFSYLLTLIGLLDWEYVPPQAGHLLSSSHVLRQLHLDRIKELIRDPKAHLRNSIGWGAKDFDPTRFFRLTAEFFPPESSVETGVDAGEPFLRLGPSTIRRDSTLSPPGLLLSFSALFDADSDVRSEGERWTLGLISSLRATGAVSGTLASPLTFRLRPAAGMIAGALRFFVERAAAARPVNIVDGTGLLTVTADNLTVGVTLDAAWNAADSAATFEPAIFANLDGGKLKIAKGDADSFVGSLLPPDGIEGDFDLGVEWTASGGLRVHGSGGIDVALPVHKQLGPVKIETVYLALHIRSDGLLSLETSADLTATIGPVAATVNRVGAQLDIRFANGVEGKFGAFDLDLRFKPPTGAGIVVNAPAITGGGFLSFDEGSGRYVGVLQLEIRGIAVKAVGFLDTRLPDGQKGYSFLIIISAEFAPVQLGLGFTLNGVGGMAGIHRTMAIEPLQAAVRGHGLDDILFPKDPVKNAARIISDLRRFFPQRTGHYVFGPMALIGWGSPTLITAELGIVIELPEPIRIALLGQVSCTLPRPDNAIVELHIDIVGVLDFGAKFFALDGTIHDSRIATYSLSGDFAVRVRWGSAPSFALAIGGFHPRFHAPSEFPVLRRIAIALLGGDNPRLTAQCYLALTSNSLQFGARAELYAASGSFNIIGWVGLDVLIIYNPFYFRADISGGFALRRRTRRIAGISVEATLTGPAPWHIWGKATISLFFFHVSVGFDVTIGGASSVAVGSSDIWPALQEAIADAGNWSAVLPPAAVRVVSLANPVGVLNALIDPVGNISLIERVAPLSRTITNFREAPPRGRNRFELTELKIGNHQISGSRIVDELFPPAQVERLSDDEKLSRPSFESMEAGTVLPELLSFGAPAGVDLSYRTVVFDSPFAAHDAAERYVMSSAAQEALARVSAAAIGGIRTAGTEKYVAAGPPAVTLSNERYVIASSGDLKARAELGPPGTKSDILQRLADHVAAHPGDRGQLVVVVTDEAEAA